MKKFFVLMIVAVLGCGAAMAQKGQMAVGGNLLYGTEINNVGLGAKFQYGITNEIRGEASFNYYFRNNSDNDDSITRFGLNLGGGCEYDVASRVTLNAEFKYSIVSTIDQAVFSLGAVYKF